MDQETYLTSDLSATCDLYNEVMEETISIDEVSSSSVLALAYPQIVLSQQRQQMASCIARLRLQDMDMINIL